MLLKRHETKVWTNQIHGCCGSPERLEAEIFDFQVPGEA
jgi:hypothetical protein